MPYSVAGASGNASGGKAPPAYVAKLPTNQQHQWVDVWNSAYEKCKSSGKEDKECEQAAFAQANGVVKGEDPDFEWIDQILLANMHSPITGTHTHSHAAYGSQGGDVTHTHSHTHKGDNSHNPLSGHVHQSMQMHDDDHPIFTELRLAELGNGKIPAWQQFHKIGDWKVEHGSGIKIKMNRSMGDKMIRNFHANVLRRRVPLDAGHSTDNGGPALAWAEDVRWGKLGDGLPGMPEPDGKGDILFIKWDYTPRGETALLNKDYLYKSPQYALDYVDKESGRHYGPTITAAAATNNPFLRVSDWYGNDAPEPVLLTDGVQTRTRRYSVELEDQVAQLTEQNAAAAKKQAELEAKLAEYDARIKTSDERVATAERQSAEQARMVHFANVETYLNDLMHKGLAPAIANHARPILQLAPLATNIEIRASDDENAPKLDLQAAVKVLLEEIPKMPLGNLTGNSSNQRPPNSSEVSLSELTDNTAKEWIKAAGFDRSNRNGNSNGSA